MVMCKVSLRSGGDLRLEFNDLPLTEQHELLPLVRHPLYAFKSGYRVEDLAAEVMVRSEEVVVGDPKGEIQARVVETVVTAGIAVRSFEGAV